MADVPTPVAYGQVTGRFVSYYADTADAGNVPDESPLTGEVVLTPLVSVTRWPTAAPPRMAIAQPVTCPVVDGTLMSPEGVTPGVYVIATDQPSGNPTVVQWRASFTFTGVSSPPTPVVFNVPTNGVVDISVTPPVTPDPPVTYVVTYEDARVAEEAAASATASAGAAAASASAAATSAALHLSGSGSPEGVRAAPVGSIYTDTLGTTGALQWVKAIGTGNTGWRVMYGDTGPRTLTVNAPATASPFTVRRATNLVYLNLSASFPTGWTSGGTLFTLPLGFRPVVQHNQGPPYSGSGPLAIDPVGVAKLWTAPAAGAALSWSFTFMAADPWPTVLPLAADEMDDPS